MVRRGLLVGSMVLVAVVAAATGTRNWVVDGAAEFLRGKGDGVAVTGDGRLVPVVPWTDAVPMEEPVLLAGAVGPGGQRFVGTGNPGRLYRLGDDGPELLVDQPALSTSARRRPRRCSAGRTASSIGLVASTLVESGTLSPSGAAWSPRPAPRQRSTG